MHGPTQGSTSGPLLNNNFIIHNSLRPMASQFDPQGLGDAVVDEGELLLVTEEDWQATENGLCENDGQFQLGWSHAENGAPIVTRLDGVNLGNGLVGTSQKPTGAVGCSSHWLDYRDGIAAVAWYEQGVRFFDVSDRRTIKQIGYYMPAVTEVWQVLYHGDYVYTFDVARGIDVLRFTGKAGDTPVLAPRINPPAVGFSRPTQDWGYACRALL